MLAFYKHVNVWLNVSRGADPLRVDKNVLTDDSDKVHAFNTYFCSIFDAGTLADVPLRDAAEITAENVDFFPSVTYEALCNTKHDYSAGPDIIPSIFKVKLASVLASPISIFFSASYQFSVLPND